MADIVSLKGEIPEGSNLDNKVIVEMLELLLARAKKGEIVAFGYFGVKPNRVIFTGWDGCSIGYTHEMVSAATTVQYRMLKSNNSEPD